MCDLFPEIEGHMREWNRALEVRRKMRRAYNRFRERRPWSWLPDDSRIATPILATVFRWLGVPKELRNG